VNNQTLGTFLFRALDGISQKILYPGIDGILDLDQVEVQRIGTDHPAKQEHYRHQDAP